MKIMKEIGSNKLVVTLSQNTKLREGATPNKYVKSSLNDASYMFSWFVFK